VIGRRKEDHTKKRKEKLLAHWLGICRKERGRDQKGGQKKVCGKGTRLKQKDRKKRRTLPRMRTEDCRPEGEDGVVQKNLPSRGLKGKEEKGSIFQPASEGGGAKAANWTKKEGDPYTLS